MTRFRQFSIAMYRDVCRDVRKSLARVCMRASETRVRNIAARRKLDKGAFFEDTKVACWLEILE